MNNVLETSFRKRALGPPGWTYTGTLFKKKGNASLYKITSVIKDGKSPIIWQEREFTISSDGVLSYCKPPSGKIQSLELRDCFLRLSSPYQDQYGMFHVHVHTVDGAPTPFTIEIGNRVGLDSNWLLCARTDREMMEWLRCILSHMYPVQSDALSGGLASLASNGADQPGHNSSDPQISRVISPIPEELGSNYGDSRGASPAFKFISGNGASIAPFNKSHSIGALSTISATGASSFQGLFLLRGLEIAAGFVLLNLLVMFLLLSPPGGIECWLFGGAINLLVCFGVLVRIEQIAFQVFSGGGGGDMGSSLFQFQSNTRSQSVPHGMFGSFGGAGSANTPRHSILPGAPATSGPSTMNGGAQHSRTRRNSASRSNGASGGGGGGADSSGEDDINEDVTTLSSADPFASNGASSAGNVRGVGSSRTSKRNAATSSLRPSPANLQTTAANVVGNTNAVEDGDSPPSGPPPPVSARPKHSYDPVDASTLLVRVGPNYRREGKKAPSEPSLLNLVGCDLYYSKDKLDCVAEKIIFPEPTAGTGNAGQAASTAARTRARSSSLVGRSPSASSEDVHTGEHQQQGTKALPGGLPHFLVINLQVQDQGPTLFGARNSSGYSLACYFEPSEELVREVVEMLEGRNCSNAARLVHRWLTAFHKDSSVKDRLKLKATVVNENANELLGWVNKYNGKPAMITKSNSMSRLQGRTGQGRSCEVVECDIDLRVWNLLFRQGLSYVLPNVGKLSFNLAFVVEGEADDELPERIMGAVQLNYIDLEQVSNWD